MKLQSRPYEDKAVKNLRIDLVEHRRVIAVSPTGSGKTVIASMLLRREKRWRKVLWLAHRYELVDQAYATLEALGLDVGIVMAQEEALHGSERVKPGARIQVASVQTMAARGVPDGIDLIVFDEAHRVMADSYQAIANACEGADVLGLTATPCRMDGRGLGDFFAMMRIVAVYSDLQANGWLSKPRTFLAPASVIAALDAGLSGVSVAMGDYSPGGLSKVVNGKALIGKVVSESILLASGVPKLVFAVNVKHSKRIAAEFRRQGVRAEHVDGKTPAIERERIVAGLASGAIEAICNVDVLSEGWDLPSLGAVVLARPTLSLARYLQMVGRVQRPFGTSRPIVIDHGANVQRFDTYPGEDIHWSLEHGAQADRGGAPRIKACHSCCAAVPWGETECPECGEELEVRAAPLRDEVEEYDVHLEEVTRAELDTIRARANDEIRSRIEGIAKLRGASATWVDGLFASVVAARG